MPGSTSFFSSKENEEVAQPGMLGTRPPPPVAPRTSSITLQTWKQAHSNTNNSYEDEPNARSASTDSLESTSSSSSGGCSRIAVGAGEYIPTRTVEKTPKVPSHNPLQFVKVQSPLYKKAEQQIKLAKEVKVSQESIKEGEEEWQSNLDNWKSRRRKVSEKVIQRAEEMRQIEAEEQLRQEKLSEQQKKIKKFSEIVDKRSTRSYNLQLYIDQEDNPDSTFHSQNSHLHSDTSEGMISEAESVDSDIHKSEKKKEPPKVPQKPSSRYKKNTLSYGCNKTNSYELFQKCVSGKIVQVPEDSSSDIEGHAADTEGTSSEDDATCCSRASNVVSALDRLGDNHQGDLVHNMSDLSQGSCSGLEKLLENVQFGLTAENTEGKLKSENIKKFNESNQPFKLSSKHQDDRPFDDQEVITCNENNVKDNMNSEMKQKEVRKGKSFAEKLAIFNSGVTEKPKTNTRTSKAKEESLVLRRRSAFEHDKTENSDVMNCRSSSFSHEINASPEMAVEKRHSVDLTFSQNIIHEENAVRKRPPPPPVPMKPKIKSKPIFSETSKISVKLNDASGILLHSDAAITNNINNDVQKSFNSHENPLLLASDLESEKSEYSCHLSNINSHNDSMESNGKFSNTVESSSKLNQNIGDKYKESDEIFYYDNLVSITDNLETIDNYEDSYVSEERVRVKSPILSESVDNGTNLERVNETYDIFVSENAPLDTGQFESQVSSSNPVDSKVDTFDVARNISISNMSLYHDAQVSTKHVINIQENPTANDGVSDYFKNETDIDLFVDTANDRESDNFKNETDIDLFDGTTTDDGISDTFKIETDIDLFADTSACYSSPDNIDETIHSHSAKQYIYELPDETEATEINQPIASPLCLSLEKIDKDDMRSASSSTSSDTPDTETVIETLPFNTSPLLNDESNGEDSSKIPNYQDKESEYLLEFSSDVCKSSSEKYSENKIIETDVDGANSNVNDLTELPDDVFVDYNCATENVKDIEKSCNEQDDEYARELDESLDQITSLDIIDRIEQSLIDQLQKQDAYEDIGKNLNSPLENDIGNTWLYFSEESELLEDLTPRNLEPPQGPPPPPPPPEPESIKNKVMSSGEHANYTKRIKKELWQRRSDFLGIESPESIDIDPVPPPPPDLTEILKQEREQTQWLEKQLCLGDPEIQFSSYQVESDLKDCKTNHYPEYFVSDNIYEDIQSPDQETWGENMDHKGPLQSYEFQHEQASEELRTNIEKNDVKCHDNPQHKAKQNIQSLGAAPKAKIMDSTKWITEKAVDVNKKTVEPVLREMRHNQNWLTQVEEIRNMVDRKSVQYGGSHPDQRYSIPPAFSNFQPDVTVRTWRDREFEYEQHRPKSAIYERQGSLHNQYINAERKDLQRTQSLNIHRHCNFATGILESEIHKCSSCGTGLCEGSAMGIEALRLYFHIECFRCCVCEIQLGNGSRGTDVQVKNNQLYCPACFTLD